MSKYLGIGDPHIVPNETGDGAELMSYALDIAKTNDATIIIMGDSFHSMNILRLEVVDFWRSWCKLAKLAGIRTIFLRGNHDTGGGLSALDTIEDLTEVVNDYYVENGILFASYTDDHKEFIDRCREINSRTITAGGADILFTHMTFKGAVFENGFECPDGIDIKSIYQGHIISGHIHKPQEIGKVHYIGAPRWRIISDANISRAIWLFDIENGKILNKTPYSTDTICKRIWLLEDTEKAPLKDFDIDKVKDDDWRVDIKGSRDYVNKRNKELQELGAKVRTFIEQDKIIKVKESDGIEKALSNFINEYQPKYGIGVDVIRELIKKRLEINV